eukprot:CAMPEP_0168621660 /NCGR_PEP_ID=MMETSP0449_2-20121227/7824_1 /TAXON_ID=1082188 /ORGANISM="Strombidium rassoulzadegani, Strain ras09" /LENGTH=42 /DNA_ID= /DNA_START= /DNA_END= /DNA_ORIENTATION=
MVFLFDKKTGLISSKIPGLAGKSGSFDPNACPIDHKKRKEMV